MSAEAPIRAESREELVYLLSQASELEHGLMCEYLFAMFSLKRQAKEGPSTDQLEAAGRWDRMISGVAAQEMLHLALVSNLLTAVGAVPHFERPNFPQQAKYYPPGVQLALVPFGERATTARVADLFNGTYEVLLQLLLRFFVHSDETAEELTMLADAAQNAMFGVLKPIGYLLTSLPVGPGDPGKTAGPTFDVYRTGYLLPHRHAAWVVLHERLTGLAEACAAAAEETGHEALDTAEGNLRSLAGLLAPGI